MRNASMHATARVWRNGYWIARQTENAPPCKAGAFMDEPLDLAAKAGELLEIAGPNRLLVLTRMRNPP
ncbi:hypothetical protein FNL53_18315 [Tardiphaga sp. vice278]|uniref:hypothetical protein n=2 Tax=Tardiphaga TaxID=1395974 RepID=UPI0011632D9F|nr:hypothetical protein [Tardiphaga sp. vice352]QDM17684.1 hypothetical protein FNL53_18315 [Tardiphaga sp. vice278]